MTLSLPPFYPVFLVCGSCVVGDGTSYRLRVLTAVAKCRLSRAEEPLGVAMLLAWLLSFFINLLFLYNDASNLVWECVASTEFSFFGRLLFNYSRSHTAGLHLFIGGYRRYASSKAHFYLLGNGYKLDVGWQRQYFVAVALKVTMMVEYG